MYPKSHRPLPYILACIPCSVVSNQNGQGCFGDNIFSNDLWLVVTLCCCGCCAPFCVVMDFPSFHHLVTSVMSVDSSWLHLCLPSGLHFLCWYYIYLLHLCKQLGAPQRSITAALVQHRRQFFFFWVALCQAVDSYFHPSSTGLCKQLFTSAKCTLYTWRCHGHGATVDEQTEWEEYESSWVKWSINHQYAHYSVWGGWVVGVCVQFQLCEGGVEKTHL